MYKTNPLQKPNTKATINARAKSGNELLACCGMSVPCKTGGHNIASPVYGAPSHLTQFTGIWRSLPTAVPAGTACWRQRRTYSLGRRPFATFVNEHMNNFYFHNNFDFLLPGLTSATGLLSNFQQHHHHHQNAFKRNDVCKPSSTKYRTILPSLSSSFFLLQNRRAVWLKDGTATPIRNSFTAHLPLPAIQFPAPQCAHSRCR